MLKHIHGDVRHHRNSLNNSMPIGSPMHHHMEPKHPSHHNTSHRLNLNLSTSKHSLGGGTSSSGVSPSGVHYTTIIPNGGIPNGIPMTPNGHIHTYSNGAIHSSPITPNGPSGGVHNTSTFHTSGITNKSIIRPPSSRSVPLTIESPQHEPYSNGVKEMLTSLGLLCVISLLLALLSLIFLLKISPVTAGEVKDVLRTEQLTLISPEEYVVVYEVTLALCALSLSLNLCCLLVCTVQFLFSVKLAKSGPHNTDNQYLAKSSATRVCAIGGLFVSIPIFLTGIILYTFIQFHSTPAIVTSSLIGVGIVFCGCAMVHNVFVWQREKTNAVRARISQQKPVAAELSTLV
ncbi:hypothetical protein M8J75_015563 [Diaphorina citri]|nr:hypothetical protein M8J75_015563 [Diaphorina citri]KAI5725400.1 hypothetical protein M8J77_014877 [Diaphorina citri]